MGIPPVDVSRYEGIPPDVKQGIPLVILRGYPSSEQERSKRLETARDALRGAEMKKTAKNRVLQKTEITITVTGPERVRQTVVNEIHACLDDFGFVRRFGTWPGCALKIDSDLKPTGDTYEQS